ncbi:hypothetical protein QA802_35535 [Streptomyces sp. B21-105]|uniref:hypothetical protein n=1 Tax=Streptomyces sp. B21-105 TaxID=3039417 RepID=UPI002FEFD8CB
MPERHPAALPLTHVKTVTSPTGRDGRGPVPPFGNRRPDRSLLTPARRIPPKTRNLPRRSGY